MSHDQHDLLLIAALADTPDVRSSGDRVHARAQTFVAECVACATLHADLRALAAATRAMPAPALPRRDFRLTEADAARLRTSGWRRLLGAFAGPRDAITRPLAMGLTTLGFAGLLIGSIGSLPGQMLDGAGTAPAPAAVPELHPTPDLMSERQKAAQQNATLADAHQDDSGPSILILVSGAALASGLAVGGARLAVRRGRGNHPDRPTV